MASAFLHYGAHRARLLQQFHQLQMQTVGQHVGAGEIRPVRQVNTLKYWPRSAFWRDAWYSRSNGKRQAALKQVSSGYAHGAVS